MASRAFDQQAAARLGLGCALVKGASSGIGRELARQLADAGVRVVALARDEQRLAEVASHNSLIVPLIADLGDPLGLSALAARVMELGPELDCVIHNAGVQYNLRFDDASYDARQIRREVDVNLVAPMVLTQSLLAYLRLSGRAWVVNVSSGLAFAPERSAAVYSATKAGLHLFTQALRRQCAGGDGSKVTIVEVVLPLVDTPMTAGRGRGKLSAAVAARELLNGLAAGRQDIFIGKARALPWLQR